MDELHELEAESVFDRVWRGVKEEAHHAPDGQSWLVRGIRGRYASLLALKLARQRPHDTVVLVEVCSGGCMWMYGCMYVCMYVCMCRVCVCGMHGYSALISRVTRTIRQNNQHQMEHIQRVRELGSASNLILCKWPLVAGVRCVLSRCL